MHGYLLENLASWLLWNRVLFYAKQLLLFGKCCQELGRIGPLLLLLSMLSIWSLLCSFCFSAISLHSSVLYIHFRNFWNESTRKLIHLFLENIYIYLACNTMCLDSHFYFILFFEEWGGTNSSNLLKYFRSVWMLGLKIL